MGRWSDWAPLYNSDGSPLKPSQIPFEGPAAYVIAASRGRGDKHTLYVGHTGDVRYRLYSHGRGEANTWKALENLRDNGFNIFYSIHSTDTVWAAKRLEENTQSEWWLYMLNILGNPTKKTTG